MNVEHWHNCLVHYEELLSQSVTAHDEPNVIRSVRGVDWFMSIASIVNTNANYSFEII